MDIERLETLDATQPLVTHLYRPQEQDGALLRFKIYGRAEPMALSDALPMLERMGLRVLGARPYRITPRSGAPYWILDFDMIAGSARQVDVMEVKEFFQDTFIQLCSGGIENDGFNRLVLLAELHWRQVVVLRALCKYLLQTRIPFSQHYIEASLANHPAAFPRLDPGDAAYQLLSARPRRPRQALSVVQIRIRENRQSAAASAAVRNLRVFAAHGGHTPSRRAGGARRHPLVGPPRGIPHRDIGPDEGADGEERRDRPGGRQRRLHLQAPARGRRPRCDSGRGDSLLSLPDPRHARPHRQLDRRQDRSAAASGALRRRRSLSRGRGR